MSTFTVARTLEEVESLRPEWEALQPSSPTGDLDVFLTYLRHAPGVVRPHVVRVVHQGRPVLVVARVEDRRRPASLGYATVSNPRVRMVTVAYGGCLGRVDEASAPAVVDALRRSIGRREADLVRLRMIQPGSPLHAAATEGAPRLSRDRFERPALHWRAALPGSFEDFLARRPKKVRWQARKDAARLVETFGDDLAVRRFRTSDGLDRLFEDSAEIHRTSYQAGLGVGLQHSALQRALTSLGVDRGWFRGVLLYLRGAPVAFCHGSLYRNTFWLETTAFNPAYAEYRPGAFLLMRLIEDLCAEGTANAFDFGFGDATYKRQLGDDGRLEQDFTVWGRHPKAMRVHLTRTAVLAAEHSARSLLGRRRLLTRTRRLWRDRAAGDGS